MEEINKVLSQVSQVVYLLSEPLPELVKELTSLGAHLPPLLKSQGEELAVLTDQISKARKELSELQGKIAQAQERHSQLAASDTSLKGRMDDIRGDVDKAMAAFRLQQAQG